MRTPRFSRLVPVAQICLGAVMLVPVAYLPIINDAHALPKALILQGLALTLFFVLLLSTLSGGTPLERRTFNVFLLLFAGAVVTGAAFSTNRELSLLGSYRRYEGLATWLSYIVIYVAAARFMTDKKAIARGVLSAIRRFSVRFWP